VGKDPIKGYRFLPHGVNFKQKISIKLPYDKDMLPPGMAESDVRTFFSTPKSAVGSRWNW